MTKIVDRLLDEAGLPDPTISIDVRLWKDQEETEIFIKKVWLEDDTIHLIWRDANKAIEKKLSKP